MATPADRARAEREAQGLPTPALPIGDADHDAWLAQAYDATATIVAAALAAPLDQEQVPA